MDALEVEARQGGDGTVMVATYRRYVSTVLHMNSITAVLAMRVTAC